ncbi:MAG: hypothetical protein ACW981_06645 [Candidatus Hodarchaeales archaeon]
MNNEDIPEKSIDMTNYIVISFKSLADQISKKFKRIDEELSQIEFRISNINNLEFSSISSEIQKTNKNKITGQNSYEEQDKKAKKKQVKDEDLLDALKFLNEGNE